LKEYRRALEIAPDYASAHYYLGLALMKQNNLLQPGLSLMKL